MNWVASRLDGWKHTPKAWWRVRPYVYGDLVAPVRTERGEDGTERSLPSVPVRIRRRWTHSSRA